MTTKVTVEAHPGPTIDVVVTTWEDPDRGGMLQSGGTDQIVKDGESFSYYVYDKRQIRVHEVEHEDDLNG